MSRNSKENLFIFLISILFLPFAILGELMKRTK